MLAIGCVVPFVTLALGTAFGSYEGGVHGGYWGAAIGACAGLLVGIGAFLILSHLHGRDA